MFGNGIKFLIVLVLLNQRGYSQEYPFWFLFQGRLGIQTTIGYSNINYYEESSVERALKNGCVNISKQLQTHVVGGQAFVDTEAGSFWMGSDLSEKFDTSAVEKLYKRLKAIDQYQNDHLFISLLGFQEIQLKSKHKQLFTIQDYEKPEWITHPPEDDTSLYATGISPQFYYEANSWQKAEKLARENLARTVRVQIQSLDKQHLQLKGIKSEEIDVVLQNIEVVARWRDLENRIFYVLIRMPK